MKLLLTSAGVTNKSLEKALLDLLKKKPKSANAVFVPTAASAVAGDKSWLIDDLVVFQKLKFKSLDIVDVSALPKEKWLKAFNKADLIIVGGGNTFHLMHWIKKSGLGTLMPRLLKTKVYVGISAGSVVLSPKVLTPLQVFFPEEANEHNVKDGLGLVDFNVLPHLYSNHSPLLKNDTEINKIAKKFTEPIYALDNNSGVLVDGTKIKIISEGKYLSLNT